MLKYIIFQDVPKSLMKTVIEAVHFSDIMYLFTKSSLVSTCFSAQSHKR